MIPPRSSGSQQAGGSGESSRLRWFVPGSDPRTCHYLPRTPDMRRNASGDPLTSIIEGGSDRYLMLSAVWLAPPEALVRLRQTVAGDDPRLSPADVRLAFAAVENVQCRLLLVVSPGEFQTLASSRTSGMPPYDAVFTLSLDDVATERATAALRGEPGKLAIEYTADLALPVSGRATLEIAARDLPWPASRSAASLRHALEDAIARGVARITVDAEEPHLPELATPLYEAVIERSVELLCKQARIPEYFHATVQLARQVREPIRAFADIGELVSLQTAPAASGGIDAAN